MRSGRWRLQRWVITDRAKRVLRNIGLIVGVVLAIGLYPPSFWAVLFVGLAYLIFLILMKIRRDRADETPTYFR